MSSSDRQAAVLAFVRHHMRQYGYPPTVREIGRAVGSSSTSAVSYRLRKLQKQGKIARGGKGCSRGLSLPDALTLFIGDEVLGETEDGRLVRVRVVEPVPAAAAA